MVYLPHVNNVVLTLISWSSMKYEHSAGIVVFYKDEDQVEYLLLHYAAGHWDFAKGHLEEGETKEQAAHRELFEESGLKATLIPNFEESFSYWLTDRTTHERVHKTVTFYLGQTFNKQVTLSHEHQGYKWLPYHEAIKHLTYGNARILLEKVHQFLG